MSISFYLYISWIRYIHVPEPNNNDQLKEGEKDQKPNNEQTIYDEYYVNKYVYVFFFCIGANIDLNRESRSPRCAYNTFTYFSEWPNSLKIFGFYCELTDVRTRRAHSMHANKRIHTRNQRRLFRRSWYTTSYTIHEIRIKRHIHTHMQKHEYRIFGSAYAT